MGHVAQGPWRNAQENRDAKFAFYAKFAYFHKPFPGKRSAGTMFSRSHLPLPGFLGPCLPSAAEQPPRGPGWFHEIKLDGFRLLAHRAANGVRLFTRNGLACKLGYEGIVSKRLGSPYISGRAQLAQVQEPGGASGKARS
jgi:ATP-dependent DNA ligase